MDYVPNESTSGGLDGCLVIAVLIFIGVLSMPLWGGYL